MHLDVITTPVEDRNTGFAAVRIHDADNHVSCSLDINFSQIFETTNFIPQRALDFLFCAAVVYAIDKHVGRQRFSEDGWTRELAVRVPVTEPDLWNSHAEQFSECVSFLTGDLWDFTFVALPQSLAFPPRHF